MEAEQWRSLGRMHSSPGVFDEVIHLYLATVLSRTDQRLEDDELLEVHWLPLSEAVDWATSGKITDAKTVIGLFRAAAALESVAVPGPAALDDSPVVLDQALHHLHKKCLGRAVFGG